MRRLFASIIVVLAIGLAGCGADRPKPLPKPLYWDGTAIWVPSNSAVAYSHAICEEANYTDSWPYHSAPLPSGGELMTCDNGTKGY